MQIYMLYHFDFLYFDFPLTNVVPPCEPGSHPAGSSQDPAWGLKISWVETISSCAQQHS